MAHRSRYIILGPCSRDKWPGSGRGGPAGSIVAGCAGRGARGAGRGAHFRGTCSEWAEPGREGKGEGGEGWGGGGGKEKGRGRGREGEGGGGRDLGPGGSAGGRQGAYYRRAGLDVRNSCSSLAVPASLPRGSTELPSWIKAQDPPKKRHRLPSLPEPDPPPCNSDPAWLSADPAGMGSLSGSALTCSH